MTIKRWMIAAGICVLAVVGCGGKVLVDGLPVGEGGAGGHGTTSGTFGMTCMNPPDPATLMGCSGSVGSGSCETSWCDTNTNTMYAAQCQGDACHCLVNGDEKCTCVNNNGAMFCSAGVTDCCPWGFKPH